MAGKTKALGILGLGPPETHLSHSMKHPHFWDTEHESRLRGGELLNGIRRARGGGREGGREGESDREKTPIVYSHISYM